MAMKCAACGTRQRSGGKFCIDCGGSHWIAEDTLQRPAPAPAAAPAYAPPTGTYPTSVSHRPSTASISQINSVMIGMSVWIGVQALGVGFWLEEVFGNSWGFDETLFFGGFIGTIAAYGPLVMMVAGMRAIVTAVNEGRS